MFTGYIKVKGYTDNVVIVKTTYGTNITEQKLLGYGDGVWDLNKIYVCPNRSEESEYKFCNKNVSGCHWYRVHQDEMRKAFNKGYITVVKNESV